MSNDVKLTSSWNKIVNLCIQFKKCPNDKKQVFIKIVNEFTTLCTENKITITTKKAVRMMKAYLEISDDYNYLIKFNDLFTTLMTLNKTNKEKWNNIINLCIEFNSKNRKQIFANIVHEFIKLCRDKNVYITNDGAIRVIKAFLEISDDIEAENEFTDLFYILMIADDSNENINEESKKLSK